MIVTLLCRQASTFCVDDILLAENFCRMNSMNSLAILTHSMYMLCNWPLSIMHVSKVSSSFDSAKYTC